MPISTKDREYMEKVADFFRGTKSPLEPNGSIRETAVKIGINRNKVRKILITMGELESPITESAVQLRQQGKSIKEIAVILGVSVATVSTALPYEDKIDNSLDPSQHASDVRNYRAYEKEQMKRQAGRSKNAGKKQSAAWRGEDMAGSRVAKQQRTKGSGQTEQAGERGTGQEKPAKEWEKDIKMFYKAAYHRPPRKTWSDIKIMREELEASLTEDSSEKLKQLVADFKKLEQGSDPASNEDEQEIRVLQKKRKLSEEERQRLDLLLCKNGYFLGALNDRNRRVLESIAGDRLPPEPERVLCLHMELYARYLDENTTEVFRRYGLLKYGDRISRDLIVPADIPLYALHYAIQRSFGWQNSHLRDFELPDDRFHAITNGNAAMWIRLVGVLFRSPLMDMEEQFWADDYNGGSFKNWLRKKFTGPYLSQCHGEGILSCLQDRKELDPQEEYYVTWSPAYNHNTGKYDGKEYISDVQPVCDYHGNTLPEPKPWNHEKEPYRVEIMKFGDLPSDSLRFLMFEMNPMALLERLPLESVLAAGKFVPLTGKYVPPAENKLEEADFPKDSREDKGNTPEESQTNWLDEERKYINSQILKNGDEACALSEPFFEKLRRNPIDSPNLQPPLQPVTDVLLYNYDFGDDWKISITASENCTDLVESGRITQAELDRANVKCREVYRPVLIARDGEMLVDDVGGLHGFADFLRKINPDLTDLSPEEKADARREKKEYLEWAKSLGWHRDNTKDFNLL